MNKSLFILFIIINGMINPNNQLKQIDDATTKNEMITINHEYYDLSIKIEPINNDFNLIIEMNPKKGAHFISPYEKKNFTGKFHMDLGSYKDVAFIDSMLETPESKEEYDPKPETFPKARNIYQNTKYTQTLKIKAKKDFKVFGRIQFTIEPSCTFEEIPFAISFENGKVSLFSPKC